MMEHFYWLCFYDSLVVALAAVTVIALGVSTATRTAVLGT